MKQGLALGGLGKTAPTGILSPGLGLAPIPIAILFLLGVMVLAAFQSAGLEMTLFVTLAAVVGGYMAINIGANDVANNVGAAVGSRALTLFGAIVIAAVFEAAGALIAGGDVVSTISKGIIDPKAIPDSRTFMLAMGSALLAGALWINLATRVGAPVSTTHAIVGGVVGAGATAAGLQAVDWLVMSKIAASWVISPVLGGAIAAGFLLFAERTIFLRHDKLAAARRWVPVLLGILAAAFAAYLLLKGLKKVWKPDLWVVASLSAAAFAATCSVVSPVIARASMRLENRRRGVNRLFTIPLICAAALLSFAHGANDVANAIGPLSAIVNAAQTGGVSAKVGIPVWVMIIGAIGIVVGLALFGPKLIRTVGEQITALDQARAFCICLSAAITVIAASALGLPVSSTHIAVGALFGVGFCREFRTNAKRARIIAERRAAPGGPATDKAVVGLMPPISFSPRRRILVRRIHLVTIVAAWSITVPVSALLAGTILMGLKVVHGG